MNDKKNIADVLNEIGDIEFKLANYRKAIEQFSTSKDISYFLKIMVLLVFLNLILDKPIGI
jgi:hypothetical protein